nr:PREDICTED: fatty-acid amide hydrolase 2 [Bemisia tabaci]
MSESKSRKEKNGMSAKKFFRSLLFHFLLFLRIAYDWVVDFIISFIYDDSKVKKIPPVKESFLLDSAVTLAAKIRKKEISSEEVVSAFIERIKEVNNVLNAVVDNRFEEAIQEAKDVDAFLRSTSLSVDQLEKEKPFLGVPFSNKESTAGKGLSFSFGLNSRRGVKATEDADIVAKCKNAGAILLCATNVPELNLWTETRNNIYGMTVNPYNTSRIVGGSSGGEASIVSACGSPIGLGTDIGGSCRMPAFYCGIFSHKPTTGLISTKGMTFRKGEPDRTMVCAGPMVKHAEDLAPLTKILFHTETEEVAAAAKRLQLDKTVDVKDIKFYYVEEPLDPRISPVSSEVKAAIKKAVDYVSEATGRPAVKIQLSGFRHCFTLWRYWMTKEGERFASLLGNNERVVDVRTEFAKTLIGKSEFTFPPIMKLIDDTYMPKVPAQWAEEATEKLKAELSEILGDDGVLIFPSAPHTAGLHYTPFFRPYNFGYWAIFNVLEVPVTQVPMGLTAKGLPVGFQVAATKFNDHLTISVAKALEQQFGGYVPPFSS